MKVLEKITKFDESSLASLLVPVWETNEIFGETGIVIGADGKVKLLGKPVHGTPEYCYSTVSEVQGMCITGDGDIVLSTSWALNPSHLYHYDVTKAEQGKVTVEGVEMPLYYLDSACLIEDVKVPFMSEELVWSEDRVYILSESASMKYLYGKLMSGNHVYSYPLS